MKLGIAYKQVSSSMLNSAWSVVTIDVYSTIVIYTQDVFVKSGMNVIDKNFFHSSYPLPV